MNSVLACHIHFRWDTCARLAIPASCAVCFCKRQWSSAVSAAISPYPIVIVHLRRLAFTPPSFPIIWFHFLAATELYLSLSLQYLCTSLGSPPMLAFGILYGRKITLKRNRMMWLRYRHVVYLPRGKGTPSF